MMLSTYPCCPCRFSFPQDQSLFELADQVGGHALSSLVLKYPRSVCHGCLTITSIVWGSMTQICKARNVCAKCAYILEDFESEGACLPMSSPAAPPPTFCSKHVSAIGPTQPRGSAAVLFKPYDTLYTAATTLRNG